MRSYKPCCDDVQDAQYTKINKTAMVCITDAYRR